MLLTEVNFEISEDKDPLRKLVASSRYPNEDNAYNSNGTDPLNLFPNRTSHDILNNKNVYIDSL